MNNIDLFLACIGLIALAYKLYYQIRKIQKQRQEEKELLASISKLKDKISNHLLIIEVNHKKIIVKYKIEDPKEELLKRQKLELIEKYIDSTIKKARKDKYLEIRDVLNKSSETKYRYIEKLCENIDKNKVLNYKILNQY